MPTCVACREDLPRTAFSKSQLKHNKGTARCLECVAVDAPTDVQDHVWGETSLDLSMIEDKPTAEMTPEERVLLCKAGLDSFGVLSDVLKYGGKDLQETMARIFESAASGKMHEDAYAFGRFAVEKQKEKRELALSD